jgi:uncharacterized protein YjbI with pentapeptide repeats
MRARCRILFMATAVTLFVALAWAAYLHFVKGLGWAEWTGFGEFTAQTGQHYRAKTLWDLLELLLVPVALVIGAWWLNRSEKNIERQIAADNRCEAALGSYLRMMTDLFIKGKLHLSPPNDPVRTLARAQTLATLKGLDPERKAQVLQFLYEADTLGKSPLVSLQQADLSRGILNKMILAGADLSFTCFIRANLAKANLNQANLYGAYLYYADLTDARLHNANLDKAIAFDANLCNARLNGARLNQADLAGAKLVGAKLRNTQMNRCRLVQCNFRAAELVNANLARAQLRQASLRETDLRKANLDGADLCRANLTDAFLSGASLVGADLSRANLTRADLRGADLTGADMRQAKLSMARLDGADLTATNITTRQLASAQSTHDAIIPEGLDSGGDQGQETSSPAVKT